MHTGQTLARDSNNMGSIGIEVDAAPLPPRDGLLSVRKGKIQSLGGVTLRSAINKSPQRGKIRVTNVGLIGDEQEYPLHGGIDKALHQYCARHYDSWNRDVPGRAHLFQIGGFGENLSTAELNETNVCIGDKFRIGEEVIVQISEPRQPCYKLNHRFQYKKTSILSQRTGRTGWYLRVLKDGHIEEGDAMELMERINPQWSVARVQQFLYRDPDNRDALVELSQLPGLGQEILDLFQLRLLRGTEDMSGRLAGGSGRHKISIQWRKYRVITKATLTPRIKTMALAIDDSEAVIADVRFGSFSHVRLKFGPDGSFTRAYSVVSGDFRSFELGIARDDSSRGGSAYLHDHIEVNDIIEVARGHDAASIGNTGNTQDMKHIFIIGGIGVTAFLRKIHSLRQSNANYEIHYAVRSRSEAAYLDLLPEQWTHLYAKADNQRLDVGKIIPSPRNEKDFEALIYCCGPQSLMDACRERVNQLKYPEPHTHYEDFGGSISAGGDPFEAEIKSTGQVLKVPTDKTLLQVLREAGLEVFSSCLAGNCGMCMVDHCSGEVNHRGVALTEEEKAESLLSCVSRGKGRIVVDY